MDPVVASGERPDLRVSLLTDEYRSALAALVAVDPVVNAVLDARLREVSSLAPRAIGGSLIGAFEPDGSLIGAVLAGGNLMPVGGSSAGWQVLGEALRAGPRVCTSFVGQVDAVSALWRVLEPVWGPCRAIRAAQPLLVLARSAAPTGGDPRVRAIEGRELDAYVPAAAAMFTEELDVSPGPLGGDAPYRRRVAALVQAGRAFGIVDADGSVIFKADIGAVTTSTCQVQGVWVRPDRRGTGFGTAAMASVLRHALTLAPTVSLYVNDYNTAARRMYARLGMHQVATFSTILF